MRYRAEGNWRRKCSMNNESWSRKCSMNNESWRRKCGIGLKKASVGIVVEKVLMWDRGNIPRIVTRFRAGYMGVS